LTASRSTFDLFAIVKQIVNAKAQFRSLVEPRAGTSTSQLMIAVLRGLADGECGAAIKVRSRIASPGDVPETSKRCLIERAPVASPISSRSTALFS
jgi:hypothetical protein